MDLFFFLEEPSAEEMLNGLLPKLVPESVHFQCVPFNGKQDLEKHLPMRLRSWQTPDTLFVVLRDQDGGDCVNIKQGLAQKCREAGRNDTLVRIACRELESYYLGDLEAVAQAIGPRNLGLLQKKAKFRDPDRIDYPSKELKKIAPNYQKVSGSREIGPLLNPDQNLSRSFNALVAGIRSLF